MGSLKSMTLTQISSLFLMANILSFGLFADENPPSPRVADAFNSKNTVNTGTNSKTEEVEPVVVGREHWEQAPGTDTDETTPAKKLSESPKISELDALETKQSNVGKDGLPVLPPKIMPAVNLHRNFEGKLVLKPRKLGFQNKFPYQLESFSGKRLAFLDMTKMNAINPLHYNGKKINVLGKLEPIEEGSKDLVIRAKIIRLVEQ
jgi:hypothetical protein